MYTASIISKGNDGNDSTMPLGLFSNQKELKKAGRDFICRLLRANKNWFYQYQKSGDNVLFSASNNQATVEIVVAEIPIGDSSGIPYACACC
jgi:hypothetical protein